MIKAILWDIDGTLLDFIAAEKAAIKRLFNEFCLGNCTDEMVDEYSQINKKYWERLERGEITKPQVLVGRFEEFFEKMGIDKRIAEEFNSRYQICLGDTIVFCDNSKEILCELKGKIKQYAVSNGTIIAQNKKLKKSGLDVIFDGIFLSEELGVEKPNQEFFNQVFEKTGLTNTEEIVIVGDSLTSDMLGGFKAGIKTCWYNPENKENTSGIDIDWTIRNLKEIFQIILS